MSSLLQGSFIESLPSKVYYRTNFVSKNNYCNAFEDKGGFKDGISKLNNYENVKSIQDKLTKALCYVAFTAEGDECKEQCRFLYYWLGNELLLNKIDENSFSKVIGMLSEISNALCERYKCKCNFFKNVTKENFAKMKIVNDYCKDHDNIEHTLKFYINKCDNKFNDYLLKVTSAYEEVYNCANTKPEPYCKELKNHVPSCFEKKLSHLKCETNQVSAEDLRTSQYNTTILDPKYVINVSAFSSSQIFLFFVLPIVGIFFIGFLLYKFTPVVSLIHTKVLKKKSIRRNLDEMDILELTEYTNEQRKSNLGKKQLNVAYHAA
ncbi:PIR protein [Plasmodium malariae]|uniref:PIR protein n=1 Tax=Plasmodium malariae TaxID=5858 RepID=A0A1D3JI36_PLAMA|nr:PIR protein [Plasmodium malariae]SBT86146.1 PIR protein [Plasmodium malariae]